MKIVVVGAGYVGLVSAACLAELGHHVVTVDYDEKKLAVLQSGGVPIYEALLPELLKRHAGKRLTFMNLLGPAVDGADAVFITVGTPASSTGDADLSFVESVACQISGALRQRTVVVEKSTVPVRTCEQITRTMTLHGADPSTFSVVSNPEFLREGTAVLDFLYPDRIVIGCIDDFSERVMREIYLPLTSGSYYKRPDALRGREMDAARLIVTNTKSAELIKHVSNAFLAMKISYINAVANIAELVGADIDEVRLGLGSDHRIGEEFLNAGIGYGGSCFPKDVAAFRAIAREAGYPFELLDNVTKINADQRVRFVQKVQDALWTLRGKELAVLGLAFKGGTDDIRESPAVEIIELLLKEGASIRAYDPAAGERAKEFYAGRNLRVESDAYAAADKADAVLILTEWPEFAQLDFVRLRAAVRLPILIDGRNLYRPEHPCEQGFVYYSMGRETVWPAKKSHSSISDASKTAIP